MVEANLVKVGTGTPALHKFGKTGYRYNQGVIFDDTSPRPDFPGGGEHD
jgi:hypothetical protein